MKISLRMLVSLKTDVCWRNIRIFKLSNGILRKAVKIVATAKTVGVPVQEALMKPGFKTTTAIIKVGYPPPPLKIGRSCGPIETCWLLII